MTKKIVSAVLALVMALSLAACGSKVPTAEELVSGGWPGQDSDLDVDVTMSIRADISAEALGIAAEELSGSMEMGLVADVHLERTEKLSHSDGTVALSMFGMSYDVGMDEWMVMEDDGSVTTYVYDSDVGDWVEGAATEGDSGLPVDVFGVESGEFTDLAMTTEGDVYVVTGRVDAARFAALGLSDLAESMTGSDVPDGAKMDVEMKYDKASHALLSFSMAIDPETVTSVDGVAFSDFSFEVVVNATSGVELSLPEELR